MASPEIIRSSGLFPVMAFVRVVDIAKFFTAFSLIPPSNPPGVLFPGREETIRRKTVLRFCQTPAGRRGWHRGLCAGCDAALPQLFQGFPRQLQEFPRRNM